MGPVEQADLVDLVVELRSELRSLRGEMARLSTRVEQVQENLGRLSSSMLSDPAQRVAIETKRDSYRTSLYALTRKEFLVRPEELVPSPAQAPSLEQLITELEREPGQ
jgi:hypothetical protein